MKTKLPASKAKASRKGSHLSFVGTVQAGFPTPGDEDITQELSLDKLLIANPPATFLMRVAGLSMKDVGIYEGDIIVVDRSIQAAHGDIVVAFVEQNFTLKRLIKKGNTLALKAENQSIPTIFIDEQNATDFTIWGVVTSVIRQVRKHE